MIEGTPRTIPTLPESEPTPEEVVQRTKDTVKKYEPRTRSGIVPFLKNIVRGNFQVRPSETADTAREVLEHRAQMNSSYAERNLDVLRAQAKAEAEADGKTIDLGSDK